jgi:hypothetical protein
LNARLKTSKNKSRPVQSAAAAPATEKLRPVPKRWQKIFLAVAAVLLATWLIVLLLMAWK